MLDDRLFNTHYIYPLNGIFIAHSWQPLLASRLLLPTTESACVKLHLVYLMASGAILLLLNSGSWKLTTGFSSLLTALERSAEHGTE